MQTTDSAGNPGNRRELVDARALFPGAERSTYMDVGVRGLLSTRVRAAVEDHLDAHMSGDWDKGQMLASVEHAREGLARLVNADPDEIAITKNASEGLNAIAASLAWRPGDNIVFCPELEHPNNVYPWLNLNTRLGV